MLLLSGVVCCLKLTLDSRRSTERFQYSRVLNIIYSDQLDLTGCIAQDTQKRYFTLYYSPKTKKYYSLEYYAYRKALVMETCDEGSGKMPLMYGARSFKVETSGRTWPVMTLVLDDGTTFRQQLVIPARYAGDGGDLR